jgi:phage replication O-like protein O
MCIGRQPAEQRQVQLPEKRKPCGNRAIKNTNHYDEVFMPLGTNVIEFSERRKPEGAVIADTDNGYTRTANEIQDRLCQLDISGSQFQVLNAIIRTTYGYNKKADRVTNTYLAELTGLNEKTVRDALIVLTARHIILCEKGGIMKLVSVNKVVSEWQVKGDKAANMRKGAEQMHRSKCTADMEQMHRSKCTVETEQMHHADGANAPSERSKCTDTKDNLPKTTNQRQKDSVSAGKTELDFSCWPSEPSPSVFRDWKTMRTAKKAPVTQTVINRLAKQIELAVANGMTVDDVLAECANRGWTGFEYAWLRRPIAPVQSRFPHEFHGQNYEGGAL